MTRFWQDPWVYKEALSSHAPILFELRENKNLTVAQALSGEARLFRRWLFQELRVQWEVIWEDADNVPLENDDVVFWNLGKNRRFSVKSVYDGLTKNDCGFFHKRIWKGKIPAKIKIFLWLMSCGAILTKDNLHKRK